MRTLTIDPNSWQVHLLPLPKRFSRGKALGFCDGRAFGMAEALRGRMAACWWPEQQVELLTLEGRESLNVGRTTGRCIPGSCRPEPEMDMHAAAWTLRDGALIGGELPADGFDRNWANGAGGDLVVGTGTPHGKPGARSPDVGLVWRDGLLIRELAAESSVRLTATDGTGVVGCIGRHAAYWAGLDASPVELTPKGAYGSEAQCMDGGAQYGTVWRGQRPRAARWHDTTESFTDLTPNGYEVGSIYHAAAGLQVGFVRAREVTGNGSASYAYQAAIWFDAAERWFDLNSVLPAKGGFNASIAHAIAVVDRTVRVCGSVSRYEVQHPGTRQESHVMPEEKPVIWTATLV